MDAARVHAVARPRWPIAFVLVSCTLAGSMCSAFVSPPVSTVNRVVKSAADTACGRQQCSTSGVGHLGLAPWREAAVSALYGAGVELLGEDMALAKFKRLQVGRLEVPIPTRGALHAYNWKSYPILIPSQFTQKRGVAV